MFTKVLSKTTKSNLALLGKLPEIKPFYLAGGTAAALQLGHRVSLDLDFYTPKSFDNRLLTRALSQKGKLEVWQRLRNTLTGTLNGGQLSFFKYPYPLLFKTKDFLGVRVADIKDIACMKVDAVGSRGIKRDFVDLYEICQQVLPLEEIFKLFAKKYAGVNYSLFHLLRSLTYFVEAEKSEMPKMLKKVSWEEIKRFFESEVKKISRRLLA